MSSISGVPDDAQFALLRLIAGSSSSEEVLNAICRAVEARAWGCTCAVLLVDQETQMIQLAAAPSLSPELRVDAAGRARQAELSTSGGPGALLQSIRSLEALEELPAWRPWTKDLREQGVRSCTLMPVLSIDLRPVGAFLVLSETPRKLSRGEVGYLRDLARLSSLLFDGIPDTAHGAARLLDHMPAVSALWNAIEGRRWIDRMMKAFPDMVYIYDPIQERLIYISPSCEQVVGYTMPELLAMGSGILGLIHPDDKDRVSDLLVTWSGANEAEVRTVQYRAAHKTAGWRWISQRSFVAASDESGRPIASFGIMQDVTEARLREQRLHSAEHMESLGRMAGGIAHDFNNLLSVILHSADTIGETLAVLPSSSVANEANSDLINAAVRARDLVQRILAFSQLGERNHEHFLPEEALDRALRFMRAIKPSAVAVNVDVEAGIGMVEGDSLQIQQVMLNLLANAEYALRGVHKPELNISLRSSASPFDAGGTGNVASSAKGVLLQIRDNGNGMTAEVLERVFEPFFTTKPVGEGTGLGLAVSLGVIQSHGGQIKLKSEAGIGTTVGVWLPLLEAIGKKSSIEPAGPPAEDPRQAASRTESSASPRKLRIALVDDEPAVARAFARILTTLGHEVHAITDPIEALRVLTDSDQTFDVLFTDQSMPGMSGTELARAVHAVNAGLPILLCSGFNRVSDDSAESATGIHAFLNKPLDRDQVRRVLDSLP